MMTYALVLGMSCMALLADYLLKKAGEQQSQFNLYFLMGMVIYAATAFIWYEVLKNLKFGTANIFYSVITLLLSLVVGIVVFKDNISVIEVVGILMALGSIVILSRFG